MGIAQFRSEGYSYSRKGQPNLFASDKQYDLLFEYVSKDLSKLPLLLEAYVSKKMDIDTFELTDHVYSEKDFAEIKKILFPLHPYYRHEFDKVFINTIGKYFNAMLMACKDFECEEDGYKERFRELTKPLLKPFDTAPQDYWTSYEEQTGSNAVSIVSVTQMRYDPIKPIKKGQPIRAEDYKAVEYTLEAGLEGESFTFDLSFAPKTQGFSEVLKTQESIKRMMYWILDMSAPYIAELSLAQRTWLYGNMASYDSYRDTKVVKHLSFKPDVSHGNDSQHENEPEDLFRNLYSLKGYDSNDENTPSEIKEALKVATEYAKTISKADVYEEYEIENLHQLLYLEVLSMVQSETKIKKCRYCGMYFTFTDSKKTYCDRVIQGETKPCSAIGSQRTYKGQLETDYPLKIYNRAYKTRHARVSQDRKKKKMTQDEFRQWSDDAKTKLDEVREGKLELADFEVWLKKS